MVNRSAEELAEAAKGNVKKKHLTKDSGMVFTYLYDEPLLEHLRSNEQPEFIFSSPNKGYRITNPNGDEYTPHHIGSEGKRYLLVTDQRILYVAGCKDGDESIEHSYDEIVDIKRVEGDNLQFRTTDGRSYKFAQAGSMNTTVEEAVDYVSERTRGTEPETTTDDDAGESKSDSMSANEEMVKNTAESASQETFSGLSNIDTADIKNDDIPQLILKIDDNIKSDETVHYAYSINAAERGEDTMGGLTTGGCLLATDRRLTAYIEETIGSSNLSVDYDKIDTVEIEHGMLITKLSVQSTSKTYSFPGFNSIDKSEIHDFADFIRDQASESKKDDTSESNIDPTEQLKNLKELHDQGVLTDEEFKEKRQSLLDEI
jgi:hypothetical protein